MLKAQVFLFTFTDAGLVTRAADPVHHLGLVPDPAPGRFPHLVGVDTPIQAHALDLGVTAALDPGPALLILMDIRVGKVIEGENWLANAVLPCRHRKMTAQYCSDLFFVHL